jgi:integrase
MSRLYANKGCGIRRLSLMMMESNFLSKEEFEVFLAYVKMDKSPWATEAYELFWFLGNFGSRISEALLNTFDDFAEVERWKVVRLWRLKKGKSIKDKAGHIVKENGKPLREFLPPQPDDVPLAEPETKAVMEFIARRRAAVRTGKLFPMSVRRAQYLFTYYLTVSGLKSRKPYLSLHSLRHTCGTILYEATGDLEFVRRRLGHASLRSVERYVRNSSKRQRELGSIRPIIS